MRTMLIATLAMLTVGSASAVESANMRNNVGVGLGTMLFEAIGSDGLLSQTAAATTNNMFFNQLFFVTTGTGGAQSWDGIVQNRPVREYMRDNLDAVARDMASGEGEALTTLAELTGVANSDRVDFYVRLQANYDAIFTSADVTSDEVLANIGKVMS